MSEKSTPQSEEDSSIAAMVELIGSRLSTATVLFHSAVADRLGVSATDVKCYTILRQTGPIAAGELAERVALTTGAITGVIDRLEKAQLVRRAPDPRDRRRVVLELLNNPDREQAILALYQPMGQAMIELASGYSAAERALLLDFITRATEILETETLRLRQGAAGSKL
ncbi:MAG TPA: MarR family transcriptional regulator [Herpetosiphonaceae bacterium]